MMRKYSRLAVLFLVAAVVLLLFNLFRQAAAPESAIIEREKERFVESFDKVRAEKDAVYAREFKETTRYLDYRTAVAYNKENKPDKAIAILQQLIKDEAAGDSGKARRSRSYQNEARYYDTLQISYSLKHVPEEAVRAWEQRDRLMAEAEEAKRRERLEEGKSVGLLGE
jgi:hypothetical protein